MQIYYNENKKIFHLQNKHVSYIFSILRNGQLGHIYFGKRLRQNNEFDRFHVQVKRGLTSFVYEGDTTFSLDYMRQEYPSYGTTDYREPAFQIKQTNGSRITDFVYKSHKIYNGKPSLNPLPATYVESTEDAITLEVTLYDEVIETELILIYTIFKEHSVIARSARFLHKGKEAIELTRVASMSVDFLDDNYEMVYLAGKWTRECHVKKRPLNMGLQGISSTRGTSSSVQNPFMALARPDATEFAGEVYGFSLVYSGNFKAQVEVNFDNESRITMGINPFDFNWLLEAGESFQTPEVVMTYSDEGFNKMSQIFHDLYRKNLIRGEWRDKTRPVLINNWEATYFDFTVEKIVEIAKSASELGVELFVLDDGWFGERNHDKAGLGDWYPQEGKLPNGIKGLAEKVEAMGLKFGLWFEPEMVNKISHLYEEHPEWVIQVPQRSMSHGRHQYILDYSNPAVVDHIYKMMSKVLREAPISYVKWDMNRQMTEIGSTYLPIERQGELVHRYILGVYDLYERLNKEFPHILFESCASGGGRFDPGMLYNAPQTWTSDDSDAVERLKIQYGTSFVYPLSSMGSHVSECPNHQVGRMTPLEMRANVAYFGTFGYELDVSSMSDEEKESVKKQIKFFKEHRELIHKGDFYRLKSPFNEKDEFVAWNVVAKDKSKALAGYYRVMAKPDCRFNQLRLAGLDPDKLYSINGGEQTYYGDELMELGLVIIEKGDDCQSGRGNKPGDHYSKVYVIEEVK